MPPPLSVHIVIQGHQQIAFARTTEPHVTSVEDRLQGYRRALKAYHLPYHEELVLDIYSQPVSYDVIDLKPVNTHFELKEIIEQYQITAVFTANDITTERLIFDQLRLDHDLLQEQHSTHRKLENDDTLASPGTLLEIAMIGEAIPFHYHNYVSIVAKQSGHRMGVSAADLLVGRIEGTITGPPQTVIVPMEILEFNK